MFLRLLVPLDFLAVKIFFCALFVISDLIKL